MKGMNKSHQRKNIIWTIDKNDLQCKMNQSDSFLDLFRRLGFSQQANTCSLYSRIKTRIKEDNLDVSKLVSNRKRLQIQIGKRNGKLVSNKNIFTIGKQTHTSQLRKAILNRNLKQYKCQLCGNIGMHNGIMLSLQLDHINGNRIDNRLQNLRFLCPNCHSQTPTFGSKNHAKQSKCSCGVKIKRCSKYCLECFKTAPRPQLLSRRKFNPTKEQLEQKLVQFDWNWQKTGEFYGVNGNSVKKRCNKIELISPYKNKPANKNFNPTKQHFIQKSIQFEYNITKLSKFYNIDSKVIKRKMNQFC